jgi:hypothetical protein
MIAAMVVAALPASAETEDRATSIGWYRPSDASFHLNDAIAADDASDRAFVYGPPGESSVTAVSGDWDGEASSSVGWYRPSDGSWHLTNTTATGAVTHYGFVYGPAGDASVTPVAGDWDGDGKDSVGWYRPGDGSWHLTNTTATGAVTHYGFVYGPAGDASVRPVAGDWDGDGKDSVGWYRPGDGSWHLTNTTATGAVTHYGFVYGPAGDASVTPVAGDWDGDRKDSVGWYRPSDASWHLTNQRAAVNASDVTLVLGPVGNSSIQPVVGDWDGYIAPVLPPANPGPPTISGQQAAADMLATGRVTGATGPMAQIRGVASGTPYVATRVCTLDPTLLGVLRTLVVDRGFSIYVTSFNRYCTNTLTGSGTASYHWRDGGGHAIDLGRVNGVLSTGGTAQDLALIREFASLVPGKAGVGQRQCRGPLALPANVVTFNDTCNHVHLEYRGY